MMNEIFWGIVLVFGALHTLCWLQLFGTAKIGKEWILHTPLWAFFPNYYEHKSSGRFCVIGQLTIVVPAILVVVYFLLVVE